MIGGAVFRGRTGHKGKKEMYGELLPITDGSLVLLDKKKMLVGRKGHCDIVLPYKQVSSEHCELEYEGGHWYVRDLGSRNGTRVNGARITSRERLEPGAIISFSRYSYENNYTPGSQ